MPVLASSASFSPRGSRGTRGAVAGSAVELRSMCDSVGLCKFLSLTCCAVAADLPRAQLTGCSYIYCAAALALRGFAKTPLVLWPRDIRIMCCSDGMYVVVSLLCFAAAADLPHTNDRHMRPERCGRQLRTSATQLSVPHSPPQLPAGSAQLPLQYPLDSF